MDAFNFLLRQSESTSQAVPACPHTSCPLAIVIKQTGATGFPQKLWEGGIENLTGFCSPGLSRASPARGEMVQVMHWGDKSSFCRARRAAAL